MFTSNNTNWNNNQNNNNNNNNDKNNNSNNNNNYTTTKTTTKSNSYSSFNNFNKSDPYSIDEKHRKIQYYLNLHKNNNKNTTNSNLNSNNRPSHPRIIGNCSEKYENLDDHDLEKGKNYHAKFEDNNNAIESIENVEKISKVKNKIKILESQENDDHKHKQQNAKIILRNSEKTIISPPKNKLITSSSNSISNQAHDPIKYPNSKGKPNPQIYTHFSTSNSSPNRKFSLEDKLFPKSNNLKSTKIKNTINSSEVCTSKTNVKQETKPSPTKDEQKIKDKQVIEKTKKIQHFVANSSKNSNSLSLTQNSNHHHLDLLNPLNSKRVNRLYTRSMTQDHIIPKGPVAVGQKTHGKNTHITNNNNQHHHHKQIFSEPLSGGDRQSRTIQIATKKRNSSGNNNNNNNNSTTSINHDLHLNNLETKPNSKNTIASHFSSPKTVRKRHNTIEAFPSKSATAISSNNSQRSTKNHSPSKNVAASFAAQFELQQKHMSVKNEEAEINKITSKSNVSLFLHSRNNEEKNNKNIDNSNDNNTTIISNSSNKLTKTYKLTSSNQEIVKQPAPTTIRKEVKEIKENDDKEPIITSARRIIDNTSIASSSGRGFMTSDVALNTKSASSMSNFSKLKENQNTKSSSVLERNRNVSGNRNSSKYAVVRDLKGGRRLVESASTMYWGWVLFY